MFGGTVKYELKRQFGVNVEEVAWFGQLVWIDGKYGVGKSDSYRYPPSYRSDGTTLPTEALLFVADLTNRMPRSIP